MHAQSGSIRSHFEDCHQIKPTRAQILENIEVIARADNRQRLYIKEAIHILQSAPNINKQYDNFTNVLKLYKSRNVPSNQSSTNNTTTNPPVNQLSPTQISINNHNIVQSPPSSVSRHSISPHISQRISQLLTNSRAETDSPSPVAHRLRSRNIT